VNVNQVIESHNDVVCGKLKLSSTEQLYSVYVTYRGDWGVTDFRQKECNLCRLHVCEDAEYAARVAIHHWHL